MIDTQEKISAEFIQQHNHGAALLNSTEMAKGILELGYLKLSEGEPPLLRMGVAMILEQ